ncbi:3-dehydroquinate synthase [Vicingaceae bacterium]|nr:3-dehydroquinate synthase [Vicingaceae bacterium]
MPLSKIKKIKTNSSDVFIGEGVFSVLNEYLRAYKGFKVFVLVDENTLEHCVTKIITQNELLHNAEILEIDSGEENKTLEVCYQLWKTLADYKADRKSLLINLGGGVITDMGGFIASTYKRGIDFINIPTTLLSQIDASVGGKTGVDFEGLKNVIGVFNEPKGVFIYPDFLKTLDKRQMLSGYAEALKHALIKDAAYWLELKDGMLSDSENWMNLITRSVIIKNDIVLNDPLEKGGRKLLNFGHTIGHAIESFSLDHDQYPLCHGEAIAVGMVCESYISYKSNKMTKSDLDEISSTLKSFYKSYDIVESNYHSYIELMGNDKKNEGGGINFTLLSKIGEGNINKEIESDLILESLNYYNLINKE